MVDSSAGSRRQHGFRSSLRRIASYFGGDAAPAPIRPRRIYVLVVAEDADMIAAKSVIRTMFESWDRFGSSLRGRDRDEKGGLQIVFERRERLNGAFRFSTEKDEDRATPFSLRAEEGATGGDALTAESGVLDGWFQFSVASPLLSDFPPTTVVMRLIGPRQFAGEPVAVTTIAKHVEQLIEKSRSTMWMPDETKAASASERFALVVMGIADASPDRDTSARVGVDLVLSPSLLPQLAEALNIEPPKVALVVTGLEREFARFNPRDPQWSRYASAQRAAWDPTVIRRMLATVLAIRPHLRGLIYDDRAFREPAGLTVTAAMPAGFITGLGCSNYNPWGPGWIVSGPWMGATDAPEIVPYHCADALISALTGLTTEFQLTTDTFEDTEPLPIGTGEFRRDSHAPSR